MHWQTISLENHNSLNDIPALACLPLSAPPEAVLSREQPLPELSNFCASIKNRIQGERLPEYNTNPQQWEEGAKKAAGLCLETIVADRVHCCLTRNNADRAPLEMGRTTIQIPHYAEIASAGIVSLAEHGWVSRLLEVKRLAKKRPEVTQLGIDKGPIDRLRSISQTMSNERTSHAWSKILQNFGFAAMAMILWFEVSDEIVAGDATESDQSALEKRNKLKIHASMAQLKTGLYTFTTVSPLLLLGKSSLFKRPVSNCRIIKWAWSFQDHSKSLPLCRVEAAIIHCVLSIAKGADVATSIEEFLMSQVVLDLIESPVTVLDQKLFAECINPLDQDYALDEHIEAPQPNKRPRLEEPVGEELSLADILNDAMIYNHDRLSPNFPPSPTPLPPTPPILLSPIPLSPVMPLFPIHLSPAPQSPLALLSPAPPGPTTQQSPITELVPPSPGTTSLPPFLDTTLPAQKRPLSRNMETAGLPRVQRANHITFAGMASVTKKSKKKKKVPVTVSKPALPLVNAPTEASHYRKRSKALEPLVAIDARGKRLEYWPEFYSDSNVIEAVNTLWRHGEFVQSDHNDGIWALPYKVFCNLVEERDVCLALQTKSVVLLDRQVAGLDKFDSRRLLLLGNVEEIRNVQDYSLQDSHLASGSLLDVLGHVDRQGKIISYSNIQGSGHCSVELWSSDRFAWRQIRNDTQYPNITMNFHRVMTADAVSLPQINPDGLALLMSVNVGVMMLAIAMSREDQLFSKITSFESIRDMQDNVWQWKMVVLAKGDTVVIPPNTPHMVIAIKDLICEGSHFLSASTIYQTCLGMFNACAGFEYVTHSTHWQSRELISCLLEFWEQSMAGDSPRSTIYWILQKAIVGSDKETENQARNTLGFADHLPMVGDKVGLVQFLALANLIQLWKALIPETYQNRSVSRHLESTLFLPARNQINQIMNAITQHLRFDSGGTEVPLEAIHHSWLIEQARTLLEHRRIFELKDVKGIAEGCSTIALLDKLDRIMDALGIAEDWNLVRDSNISQTAYDFDSDELAKLVISCR
ncbi:hypothetical protein VNI00_004015 [Paramarasmius palmivorus]|uniref:JmjC domain-containing protein n=1 Tax=Paramarasmius palmivorus TaxID=297713 RepID=A0AAW0DNE5_9AGAR